MAVQVENDIYASTNLGTAPMPTWTEAPLLPARKRPWGKYALWLLGVAVIVAGTLFWRSRGGTPDGQTLYQVAAVTRGTVAKTVTATGTLQPWSVVDIKSKAGGRVDQLSVEAGDIVKKGQVLARIDPSDTLLNVRTAQADVASARAKQEQSAEQYTLQIQQSEMAVQSAQAQLDTAKAGLSAAKARLKTAQDQASAQVGLTETNIRASDANYQSTVKQRQQLDATQPQDRASAQSTYDQAAATAQNAKLNLERQQALLAKGFVAKTVVDQAEAASKVAAAQVSSAQARLSSLEAEQQTAREAADAKVAQAQAQLENSRAQAVDVTSRNNAVKEAEAAVKQASEQVKQAQVSLAQAQANRANNEIRRRDVEIAEASGARSEATLTNANDTLSQTTVRSPIDAVVLQKYVEQGTIITSGQSLNATGTSIVQMGDISKMYVNVSVDETDLSGVTEGQPVKITVDAYKNIGFEGKVARINPQAQVENNVTTFAVRVEVDNSNPSFRLLRPGMNATCVFLSDSREDVVSLPSQAIHTDDQGSYVEIAKGGASAPRPSSDGQNSRRSGGASARGGLLTGVKVERRPVETGLEGNGVVEIVDGLQEGEKVVVQTIVPTQNRPAAAAGGSPFGGSGGGRGGMGGGMGGGRSGGGGSRR